MQMSHLSKTPLRYRLRRLVTIGLCVTIGPWLAFLVLDWWSPFPFAALQRQPAAIVTDRAGTPLRIFLPADEQLRVPVRLADVAPVFIQTLIASEDRWFYVHPGVNPLALIRATWINLRHGRIVSGASTISMQLARLAEPKSRTVWAKTQEMFRALQLERRFTKAELLEQYINLTPYGGNIEGIGAAATVYFGKTPAQLSLGEAALLSVLPRSPNGYNPARNPQAALAVRNRVLQQPAIQRLFPPEAIADARRHPVQTPTWRPPFIAPHFCQFVIDRLPHEAKIGTTLDLRIQSLAETQISTRIAGLRDHGVHSAAVVVIENKSRAVRALVGSPDFFETTTQGQVNATIARRSPGSTLKPFLYAMAMDAGRVIPDSYLLDVPTDFAGYVPENFDGHYNGLVTVREALVRSLNVPAVRLLADLGLTEFLTFLHRGGLRSLDRPAATYGLPLILGSGEVTLLDLTNLYATLATGGLHRPVQIQEAPTMSSPHGERLFSAEAAHLVTRILTGLQRPDLPRAWHLTRDVPVVAWKTGTSYGHRDAWSLGFSAQYTIGVWVGNMDGRGQKGMSGAEYAAPLLFDLFRVIEGGSAQLPKSEEVQLGTARVCAHSHELAGPYCPLSMTTATLPGRSKLSLCSLHRRIFVDTDTGEQLAGACLAQRPHTATVITVHPPELLAWKQAQGETITAIPHLSPACTDIPANEPLKIVSPNPTTPYHLRRDTPAEYQRIPLSIQGGTSASRLYWYQDGVLIGSAAPATPFLLPLQRGIHRLVVVDNTGRTDNVSYQVE